MKRFIFIFMFVGLVSCSNENEVESTTSTIQRGPVRMKSLTGTETDDAKNMYAAMIQTTEYKSYMASIRSFNDNILSKGVSFESKEGWMNWIQTNLSNTKFSSISEFETALDGTFAQLEGLLVTNKALFTLLSKANIGQIQEIIPSSGGRPEYPTETNSCLDDCILAYETAYDAAWNDYRQAMDDHGEFSEDLGDAIWNAWGVMGAQEKLDELIYETLPLQYNNCVGAC